MANSSVAEDVSSSARSSVSIYLRSSRRLIRTAASTAETVFRSARRGRFPSWDKLFLLDDLLDVRVGVPPFSDDAIRVADRIDQTMVETT